MQSQFWNTRYVGVASSGGNGDSTQAPLQQAINELQSVGGGEVVVRSDLYEFAGRIFIDVNTTANAAGRVYGVGEGFPNLVQQDNNLFVVTEAYDEELIGRRAFRGSSLCGNIQPIGAGGFS